MRQTFVDVTSATLDRDPRLAVVTADISRDAFEPARVRHPHRVLDVGIREQAMVGVAGTGATDVVLVEPYLAGTSAHEVTQAFDDVPLRFRALGVRRDIEVRAYGTAEEHDAVHGLDAAGIAKEVRGFIR